MLVWPQILMPISGPCWIWAQTSWEYKKRNIAHILLAVMSSHIWAYQYAIEIVHNHNQVNHYVFESDILMQVSQISMEICKSILVGKNKPILLQ